MFKGFEWGKEAFLRFNMPLWSWAFLLALPVLFLMYCKQQGEQLRDKRQQEINTFYAKYNCKPLGYVASKYSPIRTYVCDNGVYIAEDMK